MKSSRPKFEQRKILLKAELQRETAMALLRNLPLDLVRPLEIVVREEVKARGLDANGYYFMRVGEIADQAWFNGRQYNKEVWHEFLKKTLLPEHVTLKTGETVSKWVETPDGKMMTISTSQLERGCFAAYTESCEAFGASLGVMFTEKPGRE